VPIKTDYVSLQPKRLLEYACCGTRHASIGAVIGATAGMFLGFPGILLGPFVGAFLGELYMQNRLGAAGRAGLGAWFGFLLGTVAKVALGLSMLGTFLVARFL
jgi:uncharacterized protein YqgC (DUF456 family)